LNRARAISITTKPSKGLRQLLVAHRNEGRSNER